MVRGTNRYFTLMLVFCVALFSLAGCNKKEDVFAENNEIFFRQFLNHMEPDEIEIYSLDAYKVEHRYYYHVTYSYVSPITNDWKSMDMVYFGAYQIDNYFNLNWENWGDMEKHRDAYYAAVEKGEHKTFSQEEIQQYVNAFYSSK